MTKILEKKMKCISCRRTSRQSVVFITNTHGGPDLDTRPAEMKRSTINMWVQRCPKCGYCSRDISKGDGISKSVTKDESYKKQLNNPKFPEIANTFLCYSIILENIGEYQKAAWACIHASWVCDDFQNWESARSCRERAVMQFQIIEERSTEKLQDSKDSFNFIIVDLLRRSEQFERALDTCEEGLMNKPEKIIEDILQFQRKLIQKEDVGCYRIEDATGR